MVEEISDTLIIKKFFKTLCISTQEVCMQQVEQDEEGAVEDESNVL